MLAALVAFVLCLVAVIVTLPAYGYAFDEATYVWAAREERQWFVDVSDVGLAASLTPATLTRRWHFLEPPFVAQATHSNFNLPLPVHVMNLSWLAFHRWATELTAYRLGNILFFAATVAVVLGRLWRLADPPSALGAALALVTMPRVFGHAHFAGMETPLSCLWLLAVLQLASLAQARPPQQQRWAITRFLLLAGLLAATKLTGWLFALPALVWLLWYRPAGWLWVLGGGALAALGAVVLLTPPLWHHPVTGLWEYLRVAAANPWRIGTFYLGRAYEGDLPRSSVLVIAAITMPLTWLLLGAWGLWIGKPQPLARLLVLNMALFLGGRALGMIPGHDGERQFLPLFYLGGVACGLGFGHLRGALTSRCPRWSHAVATLLLAGGLVAEPLREAWIYREHGLSYYNQLVGGLPGATAVGLEVSYWFEAVTLDDWDRVVAALPVGAKVFFRPDHPGLADLITWGHWRPDLHASGPAEADYWLLTARNAAYLVPAPETGRPVVTDLLRVQRHAPALLEKRFQGIRLWVLLRPS